MSASRFNLATSYAGNSVDLGQLSSAVQNFNVLNNGYQGNSWTYNAYVNTSNNAARNASLNTVQTALTVAGLVPGLGSPADIANAGISALRGDYTAASISLSAAFIGGVANVGSVANKVDNGVEAANEISSLNSLANAALAAGKTSGAAAELRVGNQVFTGISGEVVPFNSQVTGALMGTPKQNQAYWHGGCAEIVCLDKALNAGVNPSGGIIQTVNIGNVFGIHNTPKTIPDYP